VGFAASTSCAGTSAGGQGQCGSFWAEGYHQHDDHAPHARFQCAFLNSDSLCQYLAPLLLFLVLSWSHSIARSAPSTVSSFISYTGQACCVLLGVMVPVPLGINEPAAIAHGFLGFQSLCRGSMGEGMHERLPQLGEVSCRQSAALWIRSSQRRNAARRAEISSCIRQLSLPTGAFACSGRAM